MATAEFVNARTGVGAGIGAVIGGVFAGPVGAAVAAVIGGTLANATNAQKKGVITPRRAMIFQKALAHIKDPGELRKLADAFRREGLRAQAELLEMRAGLRELPKEIKEKRRGYFRKAMASDDVDTIRKVSDEFLRLGALDAAKELRDHADAVQAAHTAGQSAKPLAPPSQEQFAAKLEQALRHFGPQSKQAQSAAANLIAAKGKQPTKELVAQVVALAWNAVQPTLGQTEAPTPAEQPPSAETAPAPDASAPVETVDAATADVDSAPVEGAAEAAAFDAAGPPTGAPEPTVVGPVAPVVEAPADVAEAAAAASIPSPEDTAVAGEARPAPAAPPGHPHGRGQPQGRGGKHQPAAR